jgi:hypothetical protein
MVPPWAPSFIGGGDMWWCSGGSAIPPELPTPNWHSLEMPIGIGAGELG